MNYPTFHNLIGGQWLPAVSGKTILNLNPADPDLRRLTERVLR